MQRVDWLKMLTVLATVLAASAVVWIGAKLLTFVAQTVAIIVLGAGISFVVRPLVDEAVRWLRFRALAVTVIVLGLFGMVTLLIILLIPPLTADIQRLMDAIPEYEQALRELLIQGQQLQLWRGVDVQDVLDQLLEGLEGGASNLFGGLLSWLGRVGAIIFVTVMGFVVSLYLLMDGNQRIRRGFYSHLSPKTAEIVLHVESVTTRVFGGYLRGQVFLSLLIGGFVGVMSSLFGLPYAFILGLIAGVFELIPTIGPVLGSILPIALSLTKPFPTVLYVTGLLLLVHQLESNFLVPRIVGSATGLNPLVALLSLIAGLEVAGVLGAFLSIPVVAVIWQLYLSWKQGEGPTVSLPVIEDGPPLATPGAGPSPPMPPASPAPPPSPRSQPAGPSNPPAETKQPAGDADKPDRPNVPIRFPWQRRH